MKFVSAGSSLGNHSMCVRVCVCVHMCVCVCVRERARETMCEGLSVTNT